MEVGIASTTAIHDGVVDHHLAPVDDLLATRRAYRLAVRAAHEVFKRNGETNAVDNQQIRDGHQLIAVEIGMPLALRGGGVAMCSWPGRFRRMNPHSFPAVGVDERCRDFSVVHTAQGATSKPASG